MQQAIWLRVKAFPCSGPVQVANILAVRALVGGREHPTHGDSQTVLGKQWQQPELQIVLEIADILVLHVIWLPDRRIKKLSFQGQNWPAPWERDDYLRGLMLTMSVSGAGRVPTWNCAAGPCTYSRCVVGPERLGQKHIRATHRVLRPG